ncbi:DUF1761 domain-containing protein [Rhodoferax sp.]|uniref:DUF1761 domain-containing protein n=1 Tax=Rhodoferax sp. TaxID=50421 RepID=UPI00374D1FCC
MPYELGAFPWLGVLVAAVASFALGGVWFAVLFAKPYARALGRENNPAEKPAAIFLVGPFVCGLVVATTAAIVMPLLHIDSAQGAAALGALVGLGYLGSTALNVAINPNMPRPLLYALVNVPYFFLSSIAIHVILVLLR